MLVFVDYEHADRYATDSGDKILAARTRITYRLENLAGQHCMLVRYDRISKELLEQLGATAIFISGNGTALDRYDPAALAPLSEIIRETSLPLFGFCGGFQFIAQALGAAVVPLELADGELGEFGYHPIDIIADHVLLNGLGDAPVFRHAHGLHVPEAPAGFKVLASTPVTPIQLAVNDERRILGTQFHPEYWTDEHPEGWRLIANFVEWAELQG